MDERVSNVTVPEALEYILELCLAGKWDEVKPYAQLHLPPVKEGVDILPRAAQEICTLCAAQEWQKARDYVAAAYTSAAKQMPSYELRRNLYAGGMIVSEHCAAGEWRKAWRSARCYIEITKEQLNLLPRVDPERWFIREGLECELALYNILLAVMNNEGLKVFAAAANTAWNAEYDKVHAAALQAGVTDKGEVERKWDAARSKFDGTELLNAITVRWRDTQHWEAQTRFTYGPAFWDPVTEKLEAAKISNDAR
ncbi:hypothetical protein C8R46DRAFT_1197835 [Mycena filopes]|nr:hypothetical protein C8R46DRAFT_1197835 [Mycena filopes]